MIFIVCFDCLFSFLPLPVIAPLQSSSEKLEGVAEVLFKVSELTKCTSFKEYP